MGNELFKRDYFDELWDAMSMGFGKPMNVRFNTANTKDMLPSYWSKWMVDAKDSTEKVQAGYKCVCRTIGINPNDVTVTMEDYGICLDGKTEYEGYKYSQHIELPISENVMSDIEAINYKTANGLTYIYLKVKKPEKKKVAVHRVDDNF